jgi:hypothetical protein
MRRDQTQQLLTEEVKNAQVSGARLFRAKNRALPLSRGLSEINFPRPFWHP